MKKIMLFASALAGLFLAASCQQDNLEPEQMGNTVTFTVEAPGALATKGTINAGATIADGTNVNEVHYAVYKTNAGVDYSIHNHGTAVTDGPLAQGVVPMDNKKASMKFDLLQDQEYTVLFWAQVEGAGHYELGDLRTIEVASVVDGNDETRAAFYARYDFSTYEHKDHKVTLRRPFAQLNLLTTAESLTPVQTGQTTGYTIDVKTSEVLVTGLSTTFNTLTGLAPAGDETFVFETAETPEEQGQETLVVNGKAYHYVSMNYFFVPEDEKLVDIKYTVNTDKGTIKNEIVAVPVKENYRTNVIGNLLTKESTFEIVVDAEFDGQELVEVWDQREVSEPAKNAEGQYMISTASELAWLAAAVNGTLPVTENGQLNPAARQNFAGKTFVLVEDIDLQNVLWTPIGINGKVKNDDIFKGTFDGNGKTIRNLKVATEGNAPAALFGTCMGYVKNLTVDGAEINGHYKAAAIVADGLCAKVENCTVKNATVTSTPYKNDDANHVGAIVGYLSAENTAYVKNCTVEDVTVTAYRDVAGVVGTANGAAVVSGNKIINSVVVADQTAVYKEVKVANAGAIVGRKNSASAVLENNADDNVTVVVKVNTAANLEYQANNGDVEVVLAANIEGNATIDQQEGRNVVINGDGYKYDGSIYVKGNSRFTAETVLIKNVNFEAADDKTIDFIQQNSQNAPDRYAHNVTIENCTFKGGENAVAVRFRQSHNITIKGCEVVAGHSLAQFYGCENIVIEGVTCNADRGVSFGTSCDITVKNSTFKAESYGFRADGTVAATLAVEGTVIDAKVPVVVRKISADYNVKLEDAKLFKGDLYHVVFTKGDDEEAYVAPESNFSITGADYYAVFPISTNGNYVDEHGCIVVQTYEGLQAAMAEVNEGDVVKVCAGNYGKFVAPAAKITVKCEEGVVFIGRSKLNIKGSTVEGATFQCDWENKDYVAVDQTINGVFKNCVFRSWDALRYCYAGETCLFEDCDIKGGQYGVHFDGGENDLTFRRCKISGFNAFGGAITELTLEDCTFYYAEDGMWDPTYNGVNLWGKTNLINTTFVFDGKAGSEWIGLNAAQDGDEINFTNCKVVDANGDEVSMIPYFSNFNDGNVVTIDGKEYILYKDGGYKVDGKTVVTTGTALNSALAAGEYVVLANSISLDKAELSNGNGATGIQMYNGGTFDGNGMTLRVNAGRTWDSAIATKGGFIKNLTVAQGFRGIYIYKATEKLVLENVTVQGPTYTLHCDQGGNMGLEAYNSTFNGWTSYAATIGDVKFTKCSFGKGAGYKFARPYAPTTFVECDFCEGYTIDPRAAVTFENCTLNGVALTAENLSTLVTSNIANATVK